jgi:hypothetical protein
MDLPSFEIGTVHSKIKGFQYQNRTSEKSADVQAGIIL